MKEVLEYFFCYGFLLFLVMSGTSIFRFLIYDIFPKKWRIKIKVKSDKYMTKKDPIYKLEEDMYDKYVLKFEQKYVQNHIIGCVLSIFLYPIDFYVFKYDMNPRTFDIDDVEKFLDYLNENDMTLGDYYEQELRKVIEEDKQYYAEINKIKNRINVINKEFNENYE